MMRGTGHLCRRHLGTKVDYYYAQAATQIVYWQTVQAHAILPASADGTAAQAALRDVTGLASASVDGECAANAHHLEDPTLAAAIDAMFAHDGEGSDEDFPPGVCFFPPPHAANAATAAGMLRGVHLVLRCGAPEDEWAHALQMTLAAKAAGAQVKALLQGALAVEATQLALASARLCDAGADILVVEALGGDVDEDDVWDAVDCMRENDVLGVPVAMRLGLRCGPAPGEEEAAVAAHVRSLVGFAATELECLHFDTCPLGQSALAPATLALALEEAGVESKLAVHRR
jgi:hypothetical protein